MFSPMIQNLISSSGQQSAIQRSMQLQSYINPPQVAKTENKDNKKSFAEVLKSSEAQQTSKTGFGETAPARLCANLPRRDEETRCLFAVRL